MLLWFKIKWFLFFWICWDSFCSPGIFFCTFLLLYRMFSACQWSNSAVQVFFILTGLLGFGFCFFLSISETVAFPTAAVDSSDSFFRGWAGWMTALIQWPWIWANPRRWWRTGSLACCSPWGRRESDAPEQPSAPWVWGSCISQVHTPLNCYGSTFVLMQCSSLSLTTSLCLNLADNSIVLSLSVMWFNSFHLFLFRPWWVFAAVCGLLPLQTVGAAPRGGAQASHCSGSSCRRARAPVAARRLQSLGSAAVAHGLGGSAARGILPYQGSNLCPLHCKADS